MSILKEEQFKSESVKNIAKKMILAARTAPKARGRDYISLALADGKELQIIADKMKEIGKRKGQDFFDRDAGNVLQSEVLVLMGTIIQSLNLNCSMCGYNDCAEKDKHPDIPCVFNTGDLGIAIGSAVSVAMDHRVDNRILYSAGQAILELGLLGTDIRIAYGIPLSALSKNIFFDRKPVIRNP